MKFTENRLQNDNFVYNESKNCLQEILSVGNFISIPIAKNIVVGWHDNQVLTLHKDFEVQEEKCNKYGCGNSECIFECINPKFSAVPTDQSDQHLLFHESKIEGLLQDMNKSFLPNFQFTPPPPDLIIKEFTVNTKCISKEDLEKEISETKAEIIRYIRKDNESISAVKHLYEYIIFSLQLELTLLEKLNRKYFKN